MKHFIFIIFFLGFFDFAQAANSFDVVINEIAWMGTEISYNDEWIELYDNTDSSINLEGWVLKTADGSPEINLTGTIPVNGFYLLERTNDDTVPGITTNQIYTGALNNSGENLELYDGLGNLIDSVDCGSGWFGGDNSTKQTMERINSLLVSSTNNWQTSQNPGGTPKAENSIAATPAPEPAAPGGGEPRPENSGRELEPPAESQSIQADEEPKATSAPTEKLIEVKPPSITYPSGVVINEVMPSPAGPDAEEEWIEIYNQNGFQADLSDWRIEDLVGKTNLYIFPEGTTISPQGFLVLSRPATEITLNNSGDGLNLIQPDGEVTYTVNYEKAPRGESYNLIESNWTWSTTPTPGNTNIIPRAKEKPLENNPPEVKTTEVKQKLAAIGEQIPNKRPRASFILLIAGVVAIFSGVVILMLKNKVKTSYNKET